MCKKTIDKTGKEGKRLIMQFVRLSTTFENRGDIHSDLHFNAVSLLSSNMDREEGQQ